MNGPRPARGKLSTTIKKSEAKVTSAPDSKSTKTLPHQPPPHPSDPYVTVKDAVWKDIVIHERKLDSVWNNMWSSLILPNDSLPASGLGNICTTDLKKNDAPVAEKVISPANGRKVLFAKSSAIYGSFASDDRVLQKQHAMGERPLVSRIRFVPQQYGHYRKLKYVKDAMTNPKKDNTVQMPSSKVRHTVNPLLC